MKIRKLFSMIFVMAMLATSFAVVVPSNVASSDIGLVAHWKFDEGEGTTVHDEIGDNDGTIYGATWVNGRSGNALEFDGIDNRVIVPNDPSLNLGISDITISAWVLVHGIDTTGGIVSKRDGAIATSPGYTLGVNVITKSADATIGDGSGTKAVYYGDNILTDGEWHLLTAVSNRDGNGQMYIDGVPNGSPSSIDHRSGSMDNAWDLIIGTTIASYGAPGYFHGVIDDVCIYNRLLSSGEILGLYYDIDLVAHWKFDEGSGDIAEDSSGNNNHGTIHGAAYVNGISAKALDFQGSLDSYVLIPDSDTLDLTGDFTIEEWINVRDIAAEGAILAKYDSSSSFSYQVGLYGAYGGKFLTGFSSNGLDTGSSVNNVFSNSIPELNNWYYVVSVHEGNELRIYINGQLDATKTSVPLSVYTGDSDIYIAKSGMAHEDYHCFNGIIDEVRIWSRALDIDEINEHYYQINPRAHWKFDEGDGNIAHDSGIFDNHGTIYGATWTEGISGRALSFDGINDHVDVADNPTLSCFNEMTAEAWIKVGSFQNKVRGIVGKTSGSPLVNDEFGLQLVGNSIRFYITDGSSILFWVDTAGVINEIDRWYHVAGVWDGTSYWVYVNGQEIAHDSSLEGMLPDTPQKIEIGTIGGYSWTYFHGVIDEVQIYSRALSASEIWNYYYSMLPDLSVSSDDIIFTDTNPTVGDIITIDTTIWNFGPENSDLGVGVNWVQATSDAHWSARYNHKSVVFNDKIWVIGGATGLHPNYENDIWSSTDGVHWTQAPASSHWSARYGHTSVVFDNKIWVLGGYDGSQKNDVWHSSDGVSWTMATASAPWSARNDHASIVYDNKIWVIGGISDFTNKNDVWWSSDGTSWTQAIASAPWPERRGHSLVSYNNKMWLIGGYDEINWKNDVWYSIDGSSWTQAPLSAPWSARGYHNSILFNDKIWVIGGNDGSQKNDIWYSSDGFSWSQATAAAQWKGRQDPEPVVFDGKLWIMGGYYYDGGHHWVNDVWSSVISPITSALISFYDGNPEIDGVLIDQYNIIIWGGTSQIISIDWTPTTVEIHDIYVYIEDVNPDDADWSNNIAFKSIFVNPIEATIDIDPDTIQLGGKGKWITCYIELPEGYDVEDIDASKILLKEELAPVLDPKYDFVTNESIYIVDHDEDGILERMVKFDRDEVEVMLSPGTYLLKVTAELFDGRPFEGFSDEILVINPP